MHCRQSLLVMVAFLTLLGLGGCGAPPGSSAGNAMDTRSPISQVALTQNVLTAEARMPVYSKVGERVGLLDPLNATETWGASAPGFEFGVALHDLSGVALFGPSRVLVATPNAVREFTLSDSYYHAAAAARHTSFAVASAGSARIEIVHALGGGLWQQMQLDLPWTNDLTVPAKELQLFFNENGTKLVAFSMIDGRYATYRTTGADAQFMSTGAFCAGTSKPVDATYLFTAATWLESAAAVVAVDRVGSAHLFAVDQPCVEYTTRPSHSLGLDANRRVTTLIATDTHSVLALVAGGDLLRVSQDGSGGMGVEVLLASVCVDPIGAMLLPGNRILMACAETQAQGSAVSKFLRVESARLTYFTYDSITKHPLSSFSFLREETAGSGIFPEKLKLYRATESSLGELEVYDLITGEARLTKGVYIGGLLDTL